MNEVTFKLSKKELKEAISKVKRVVKSGEKVIFKKDIEKDFFEFIANNEFLGTFHYINIVNETDKSEVEEKVQFGIKVDPRKIEKWLTGKDRVIELKIKNNELIFEEMNKKENIEHFIQKSPNLSLLEFKPFQNPQNFISFLSESNKMFQKNNDEIYSSFLKITDKNIAIYDPISVCVFFLEEELDFANNITAIEKTATDVLAKSIKKPKNLKYYVSGKNLIVCDEQDFYIAKLEENVRFPTVRNLKILCKKDFTLNATELKNKLKEFKNDKVPKVAFEKLDEEKIKILPRGSKEEFEEFEIEAKIEDFQRSVFQLKLMKDFLEGFEGETTFSYMEYKTKTQQEKESAKDYIPTGEKNYYMWGYKDNEKSKMIAGIIEPTKS